MKNSIIFLFAVLSVTLFSCGNQETQTSQPQKTQPQCHTELVKDSLANSTVAKEVIIASGQFVNGVVKDHKKNNPNYTKEMFLADNPEIAKRPLVKKLDPCDSTKVKYVSIPLHQGDVILLRLPYQIDTLPGSAESIVWKSAHSTSHIKQILDIDDKGRVVVEDQNICCCDTNINPCPPQKGDVSSPEIITNPTNPNHGINLPERNETGESDTPWWVWVMLALLVIVIIMITRNKKADPNSVENITKVVREEGKKNRDHVTQEMNGLGSKMDKQTEATKETNKLLEKILENGQPK
jgi:LPXTG-motif cell wall-anchored protein